MSKAKSKWLSNLLKNTQLVSIKDKIWTHVYVTLPSVLSLPTIPAFAMLHVDNHWLNTHYCSSAEGWRWGDGRTWSWPSRRHQYVNIQHHAGLMCYCIVQSSENVFGWLPGTRYDNNDTSSAECRRENGAMCVLVGVRPEAWPPSWEVGRSGLFVKLHFRGCPSRVCKHDFFGNQPLDVRDGTRGTQMKTEMKWTELGATEECETRGRYC